MYIKSVRIKDFKNFSTEVNFNFCNKTNIIIGKNGCGKTSILDAITWCLIGRLSNGSQQGWKPKVLHVDQDGNAISKVKDIFDTIVEIVCAFDDDRPDVVIKRMSNCGKSTTLYLKGVVETQKIINQFLQQELGFDISKLLIYTNPEILFNQDDTDQKECREIIFDTVRHKVKSELEDLYVHLFDNYKGVVVQLPEDSVEKSIATKLVNSIKRQLDNNISENDVLEDIQKQIDENILILNSKTETINSQELVINEYHLKKKQEPAFHQMESDLDKAEQKLREQLFQKSKIIAEKDVLEEEKNKLVIWLDDFNALLASNPSNEKIKEAFGLPVSSSQPNSSGVKINVLNFKEQKIKCPVCGNWYVPPEQKSSEFLKKVEEMNKSLSDNTNATIQQTTKQIQQGQNEPFNYLPKLAIVKQRIVDLKQQLEALEIKLEGIDRIINSFEIKTIQEIQSQRNEISKFFAGLETGARIQKQINNMKLDCEECNITNRYLNILLETIKSYIKAKFRIIMAKLNQNLTSGMISLFKIQANGTLKECVTIIDKSSNASYSETNQSNKIKLGIEVCKLLQDFNDINIPIFIDEIGRFNDYSFIKEINHQIIATKPTNDLTISIIHE